jgi:hypothetical protein
MAEFPSFGNASRGAPSIYKELYPNVQYATNVVESVNNSKNINFAVSIVNLNTNLVISSLSRIFTYAVESVNMDLIAYTIVEDSSILIPSIHFEIDITKAVTQTVTPPETPGGVGTVTSTTIKTANIDILIENLQISLIAATLQRIKDYMTASIASDLNP